MMYELTVVDLPEYSIQESANAIECDSMLKRNRIQRLRNPLVALSICMFCMEKYGVEVQLNLIN
jgi:hypothetical protein